MGNALGTVPKGPKDLRRSIKDGTSTRESNAEDDEPDFKHFTPKQLQAFTGAKKTTPIYIALKSIVYDCTSQADEYGPNGRYGALAGKDASRALALKSMDALDLASLDLSDLTASQQATLKEQIVKFTEEYKFPVVGRLVVPMDLTRAQLKKFNGVDNDRGTVLIAVSGVIYDVTMNGSMHYGPDGTYAQFAGQDASRALACMSLDSECLEDVSLKDLSPEQRSALADWCDRFQKKYAVVGNLR